MFSGVGRISRVALIRFRRLRFLFGRFSHGSSILHPLFATADKVKHLPLRPGRRKDVLDAAVGEIGEKATGIPGDVANLNDLDRLYKTVKRHGRRSM